MAYFSERRAGREDIIQLVVSRSDPAPPLVTVVVATFNRPDALAEALASLVHQTCPRWVAWVIGDGCDPRTEAVVSSLQDSRVRFLNLPERCGDQSGPNTIGASLCRTPYLAFLNHDDLWLPDHLEHARAVLDRSAAELFIARSFWVVGAVRGTERAAPVVMVGATGRALWKAAIAPSHFEPVSAWVVRADSFRRVGDWRDGFELFRVPMADWLLRAARARLRLAEGDMPTVVRVNSFWDPANGPRPVQYAQPVTMLRTVRAALDVRPAHAGREWLQQHARAFQTTHTSAPSLVARVRMVSHAAAAAGFVATGYDLWSWWCRRRGRVPGSWKRQVLRVRTGDELPRQVDMDALMVFAHQVAQGDDDANACCS